MIKDYWFGIIIFLLIATSVLILITFTKPPEPILEEKPSIFILSEAEGDFDGVLRNSNNFKQPDALKLPLGASFDCLLIKYEGRRPPRNIKGNAIELMGGGRIAIYPSSHVAVVIPLNQLNKVKAMLGKDATPISR